MNSLYSILQCYTYCNGDARLMCPSVNSAGLLFIVLVMWPIACWWIFNFACISLGTKTFSSTLMGQTVNASTETHTHPGRVSPIRPAPGLWTWLCQCPIVWSRLTCLGHCRCSVLVCSSLLSCLVGTWLGVRQVKVWCAAKQVHTTQMRVNSAREKWS